MKQQTLAMASETQSGLEQHRKPTRRDEFLKTMEALVPSAALCEEIAPYYPKAGNGRPPIGLERMLRIHFIQHWFNLADLACEEALYDSASLRRFAGIDLGCEPVPDATTMLRFRRLLNDNKLGKAPFARVGQELQARGIKVNTGTIVDATIIGAPSSTKNANKAIDPEMHQTRKGQQWHFGMKLHIGVDSQTGLPHSAVVTPANVHDKHPLPDLLHGNERRLYGDSAYARQKALGQYRTALSSRPACRHAGTRRLMPDGLVQLVCGPAGGHPTSAARPTTGTVPTTKAAARATHRRPWPCCHWPSKCR